MKVPASLLFLLCFSRTLFAQGPEDRQSELKAQFEQQLESRSKKMANAHLYQKQVEALAKGPLVTSGGQDFVLLDGYMIADPKAPSPNVTHELSTPWGWQLFKKKNLGVEQGKNGITRVGSTLYFPALRPIDNTLVLYATGRINVVKADPKAVEAFAASNGFKVIRSFSALSLTILEIPIGTDILSSLNLVRQRYPLSELDIAAPPQSHDGFRKSSPH